MWIETHRLSEQAIEHTLATGDTDVDRDSLAIRAGHRASLAISNTVVDRGTHSLSEQAIEHSLATGDTDVDRATH